MHPTYKPLIWLLVKSTNFIRRVSTYVFAENSIFPSTQVHMHQNTHKSTYTHDSYIVTFPIKALVCDTGGCMKNLWVQADWSIIFRVILTHGQKNGSAVIKLSLSQFFTRKHPNFPNNKRVGLSIAISKSRRADSRFLLGAEDITFKCHG